jgi:predicted nucleic acid-binding protein
MIVLLDTNILVRISEADHPRHGECLDLMRRSAEGDLQSDLCICAQNLIEYWAVATRPLFANGLGLSTAVAATDILQFQGILRHLSEPSDIVGLWFDLVRRYDVRGRQVHDTRLVALMLSYGINHIVTLNPDDFSRYTEITCLAPAGV